MSGAWGALGPGIVGKSCMNKQDIAIVVVLFGLLLAWPIVYPRLFPPAPRTRPVPADGVEAGVHHAAAAPHSAYDAIERPSAAEAESAIESDLSVPAALVALTNEMLRVVFSTRGGGMVEAVFNGYKASVGEDSGFVRLDMSEQPALSWSGLPGLGIGEIFEIKPAPSGRALTMERRTAAGLQFTRTVVLEDGYRLHVTDVISNCGVEAVSVPACRLCVGGMTEDPRESRMQEFAHLGVDSLPSTGGEGVQFWSGRFAALFKEQQAERGLAAPAASVCKVVNTPADWVAVKNKFFVQILQPEGGSDGYIVEAERESAGIVPARAVLGCAPGSRVSVRRVAAHLVFRERSLGPGESSVLEMFHYVGPKKFSVLRTLGLRQDEVMEFGMWKLFCKWLLVSLNFLYDLVPNYGVAIILLTVAIRILFWPVTHKSTQSMRKLQELQPLMNEIKVKFKNDPKRMQEETMALYRKHKVNPMGGCLPMLIQIPVFIALYRVLASAIELRLAPFLWIADLSEPEHIVLFAGQPIPLNILPLVMTGGMVWQQLLTPAGDPSQQRMMTVFMPLMMLFFFYNMPSALVLYWTVNQFIMIGQQLVFKYRTGAKAAAAGPARV